MPGWIDTHVHFGQHVNASGRATSRDDTPAQATLFRMESGFLAEGPQASVGSLGARHTDARPRG